MKELITGVKLQGQFDRNTKDIEAKDSCVWLTKGELKCETESLLVAAQVQDLNTKNTYHKGNPCK